MQTNNVRSLLNKTVIIKYNDLLAGKTVKNLFSEGL